MILNSKYDIALGYLNLDNPDNITQAFHEIAWVESKGIVDRKQNDDPDAYAKGLGLGKYQYEPESAKTALTRYKNWHEKNQPPNLDDMYAEAVRRLDTEDYDFSTLSEDHQDVYNLINYQQHPKTKMKDLSSGAISPKSFWAKYHATIGKFSEEDRFKQWENQIKGLPELFSTKQSSGFSNAFVNLAPTVGDQEVGLSGVAGMNTTIGDGFVAYKQDDTTGLNVPINSNTSFVAERRPAYDGGKENYIGVQYNKRFQEGGEIQDEVGINPPPPIVDTGPDVISEVKPNTTLEIPEDTTPPPTYDKTEGFYSVNPAPDETADQFVQRTTETQPAITTQPVDEGSWSPPEGYVSPRISTSFEDLFGDSSWGSTAGTTTTTDSGTKGSWVQTDLPFPKDTSLSPSQQSALTLLGISNDVVAAEATKVGGDYGSLNETFISDYLYNHFGIGNFNQIDNLAETGFKNVYGLDDTFTDSVNVELQKSFDQYGVKTLEELKIKIGAEDTKYLFQAALDITKTNQIIDEISKVEGIDSIMTFGSGKTIGPWNVVEDVGGVEVDILDKTDWSQQYDVDGNPIYTSEGMLTESVSKHVNDWASTLTLDEKDILIDLGKEVTPTKWFETISNKTIGNMYGHEMQVKDLYDEFGATLFVGYMTEDWGKAALAGGTQFLKTDFVKGFSSKIGTQAAQGFSSQISGATSVAEINATFKKAQNVDYDLVDPNTNLEDARRAAVSAAGGQAAAKFELYAGVAASMFQSFVMGGDTEDVIWAGAEHAIMHFGAQPVGEFLNVTSAPGIEGGAFNAQEAVGGAVISSLITLARTGDIGQAALSGGTSYLFAVNPVFGTLAMMTQVMFGQGDPKNYAGYTSVNLEDMSVQSFSQGDVDKSKASPENTAFTQEVVNNIMPLLEPITEAYGVTKWLGDVEIQYGHRDGLFLTIVNKDITGFTNRADYNEEQGDLSPNDVYQRKFNSLADLQDHFMEIMTFAAEHMRDENGVVDLTGLIGQRNIYHGNKFYEYVNEKNIQLGDYSNRGAGIVNFENIANIQDTYSDNIKRGGFVDNMSNGGYLQETGYLEDIIPPESNAPTASSEFSSESNLDSIQYWGNQAERYRLKGDMEKYKEYTENKNRYIEWYRDEYKNVTGEYPSEEAYTFFEGPTVKDKYDEIMLLQDIEKAKNKGFREVGGGKVPETWRDDEEDLHKQVMKWKEDRVYVDREWVESEGYSGNDVGKLEILAGREEILDNFNTVIDRVRKYGIDHKITKQGVEWYIKSIDGYENDLKKIKEEYPLLDMSEWDYSMLPNKNSDWDALAESLRGISDLEEEEKQSGIVQPRDETIEERLDRLEKEQEYKDQDLPVPGEKMLMEKGGKISLDKGGDVQYNKGNYGFVNKKDKAPPSARADDVPMNLKEGDFVLSQPAVALYGKDTIDRMLSRAATDAGTNLKSGGKVPVNVHNGEYIIPKNLTEYIGSNVLNTMNDRGLMSVGERPNT